MEHEFIEIVGARANNLKNISLKIPKKKITIFTGVSGSGKSTLVNGVFAKEHLVTCETARSLLLQNTCKPVGI
jgi:excinuclease UvrABC ATPase subunit